MKKHILVLGDLDSSGEWIALARLVDALKKNHSFRSYLVAFAGGNKYSEGLSLFERHILLFPYDPKPPLRIAKFFLWNLFHGVRAIVYIVRFMPSVDYVFVTHYIFLYTYYISCFIHRKRSQTFFFFQGLRNFSTVPWWDFFGNIRRFMEHNALLLSDTIIIPSSHNKYFVKKLLKKDLAPTKIQIVPNIVPDIFFTIPKKNSHLVSNVTLPSRFILFCGRMKPSKGIKELVHAFILIKKRYPYMSLVIANPNEQYDQSYFKEIKQIIQEANEDSSVIFLRDVSQKDLLLLYHRGECTVLPSIFEMSPLVVLESLACGTPVIATHTGDIAHNLSSIDPNLLLHHNSPDAIVNKLCFVLMRQRNTKWREHVRRRAFAISSQHRSEFVINHLLTIPT